MQTAAVPSSTQNQQASQAAASQLSSGKRTTSAAVDPSALAIANALTAQRSGFAQGASNAQGAVKVSSVASGAIVTISDAARQLYTQSVADANGVPLASDHADLQTEANHTTSADAAVTAIGNGQAAVGSQTVAPQKIDQDGARASNNVSEGASDTRGPDAISTVTSLMQERTNTQITVALQVEANLAFSAVLGIFPR